ncbi:Fructose dehydrogenase large subunit [Allorhodopirellula heiligendammensis]|uniref:Fructose dehydrogenase large subunit n=2 Tax=Allorhodopirellula heiligendammensis TaxID=2714739 RepID=A0A5C6BCB4_9BACT|nr:Fructose dehydrogenase large subunit [Allorhodopirellula heiligendammensis]
MAKQAKSFDYVIIGSGVAGALVAQRLLAKKPATSIAIVEAGKRVPLKDRRKWWDFVATGINPYDDFHDLPIENENESIGDEAWTFRESRLMGRGGSTVHWGGWALRFKEEDFETCSRTGRGADWPIGYNELEPYYEIAEHTLGVSGLAEDSAGKIIPPRASEYPIDAFPFAEADRPLIHAMERLDVAYAHMPVARFRKCMTTGTCRYCPFGARFAAAYVLDELECNPDYPNLAFFEQSPCERLIPHGRDKIASIEVTSTQTGESSRIEGDRFIVASGAYESPKLLQRSTSTKWPRGIGNDTDLVGRFLISHPFLHVRAVLPSNANRWNQELDFPTLMSRHFDSPEQQAYGKLFLFKDRSRPKVDLADLMIRGKTRSEINRVSMGPMELELQGFMEEFSIFRNRVSIGNNTNRIGLPQTQVDFSRESDFVNRAATRLDIMEKIVSETGAKIIQSGVRSQRGDHSACTCRMGTSPATSVVDPNLQVHGVENLWVCSNAVFPSGAAVNPTLTLSALATRLADHLLSLGGTP